MEAYLFFQHAYGIASNVRRFPVNPRVAFMIHHTPAKLLKVVEMSFEKHSYDDSFSRLSFIHNSLNIKIAE